MACDFISAALTRIDAKQGTTDFTDGHGYRGNEVDSGNPIGLTETSLYFPDIYPRELVWSVTISVTFAGEAFGLR
jgi:hypothetical protein